MKKRKKDDDTYMKAIKVNINDLLKNNVNSSNKEENIHLYKIKNAVYRTNIIVHHTYNFLKLYLIWLYKKKINFPIINRNFIKNIMRIISKRNDNRGRNPSIANMNTMNELQLFYDKHYKHTINEKVDLVTDDKISFILEYEQIDIIKNIQTNIKEHLIKHINRFVNLMFDVKGQITAINKSKSNKEDKKTRIQEIYTTYRKIKNDILSINEYESDEKYHEWIDKYKYKLICKKENYAKNSIPYDIKANSMDYLRSIIYINKRIEKMSTEENKIKLFNAIPIRTSIIPKTITLDTCSILLLLFETKNKKYNTTYYMKKIKENSDSIWKMFFKTNKSIFRKNNYSFNHMIKTDGYSCSILFKRLEDVDIKKQEMGYIEDVKNIKKYIGKKNYVTIDPGHNDLWYCVDKNGTKFRYTQYQRQQETRNKKYKQLVEGIKKTDKRDGKTIKEIETTLSNYNSKTCNFKKFKQYLKEKNKVNRQLLQYYNKKIIYRKLNWYRYINVQKSESLLVKKFKEKYGKPEEVKIIVGDYENKENIKGHEPMVNKRLRYLFKKNGYDIKLINEYKTSKVCNKCYCKQVISEVETFLERPNKKGNIKTVWGLTRCTNDKCMSIFNRDNNACENMQQIVRHLIKTKKRPQIFCREYNTLK